jgi:PBP1b-binding outer membrane lipoprotein LpoB
MKKLILILLPAAIFLAGCAEETPIVKPLKTAARAKPTPKPKSDNPEEFRAVEKPSSYGQ